MRAYNIVAQRPGRRQYMLDPVLELHNGDGAGIAQNELLAALLLFAGEPGGES